MPFDKKLACLTNYQERRSFPWPLVFLYLIDIAKIRKQFVCGSDTFSYREAKNMYTCEWFGKVSHKFLCCQEC